MLRGCSSSSTRLRTRHQLLRDVADVCYVEPEPSTFGRQLSTARASWFEEYGHRVKPNAFVVEGMSSLRGSAFETLTRRHNPCADLTNL